MSLDVVDDLHEAEDYGERLRLAARDAVVTHEMMRKAEGMPWPERVGRVGPAKSRRPISG